MPRLSNFAAIIAVISMPSACHQLDDYQSISGGCFLGNIHIQHAERTCCLGRLKLGVSTKMNSRMKMTKEIDREKPPNSKLPLTLLLLYHRIDHR